MCSSCRMHTSASCLMLSTVRCLAGVRAQCEIVWAMVCLYLCAHIVHHGSKAHTGSCR